MSEETELAEDAATETMDAETAARVSAENMRLLERALVDFRKWRDSVGVDTQQLQVSTHARARVSESVKMKQ